MSQAAPLVLEGVVKTLGRRRILDGLSFTLAPGEVVALLGANGAGKTTTLNLILGLLRAERGRVAVAGIDVAGDPAAARARTAYLPEQVALYPHLSGIENLRYFAGLAGLRLDRARCEAALTEAGLPDDAWSRRASGYSKGMRQKVGIAIALTRETPLLLLDEPATGLDPRATGELANLVRRIAAKGTAVLVVTHDLFGVRAMADRAILLADGRIGQDMPAAAIDAATIDALYGTGGAA